MIDPEKLNIDVCEALARNTIDGWDMETLLDYAISCLTMHFFDNKKEAIEVMEDEDFTIENLLEAYPEAK